MKKLSIFAIFVSLTVMVPCGTLWAGDTPPPGIEEEFEGTALDQNVWTDLGEGQGVSSMVVDGSFHAVRSQKKSKVGLRAKQTYALAPEKNKVLRFSINFAPERRFITKNNFFFGMQDESGQNGIVIQTGQSYGYGPWGVVITCEGKQQKSVPLADLNALPACSWLFEITPHRIKISQSNDGKTPSLRFFDSKRSLPQGGGEWAIPTMSMVPVVLDSGSTGLGNLVIGRIRFSLDSLSPQRQITPIPKNGLGKELVLASNTRPHAYIVVADETAEKIQLAASDLQKTIQESTGALLPIIEESDWNEGPRILVGASKATESLEIIVRSGIGFRDEQSIVRRIGTDLVIMGNDNGSFTGTQDAAICFLNDVIGAYYYYPSPLGKVVPKINRLAVGDISISEEPSFSSREIAMYSSANEERAARLKEFRRWNHSGGAGFEHRHSHMFIAPPKKYFKDHPEYYSEVRGERSVSRGWQLCTTNPDVIKLAVERSRRFLDRYPASMGASVSPNDGGGMCTCIECRKLDEPDPLSGGARRVAVFANAVARELAKTHPGKYVAFYAYLFTLEPPVDIKLESNVIVVLADSGNCMLHSYDDPECGLARDAKLRLKRWSQMATHIKFYDYYGLFGDYLGLPFCNINRTITNNAYLHSLNGLGQWYDAKFVPGPQGLHYWTGMRSLWDGNLTVDNARKQFSDGLYGKASKAMQTYYSHLEDFSTGSGTHSVHVTWVMPGPLHIWTDEAFGTLDADLQKAMALVPAGSQQAQRIDEQLELLDFAKVFVSLKHAQISYWRNATVDRKEQYLKMRSRYLDFCQKLSDEGLIALQQRTLDAYAPEDPELDKVTVKLKKTPGPPNSDPLCSADLAWDVYGHYIYCFKDNGNFLAYPKTRAYLACDDQALYVRVNLIEYHMDQLKAQAKKRDGEVWQDDCIRFSIALPSADKGENRYDFYVNADGVHKDAKNGRVAWNGDWSSRVAQSDVPGSHQWAVRIEIPWSILGLTKAPKKFKANLFRHAASFKPTPVSSWVSTFGSPDNTNRYAMVTIGDELSNTMIDDDANTLGE